MSLTVRTFENEYLYNKLEMAVVIRTVITYDSK